MFPRPKVPFELRNTPPLVLEDYVRARLGQFVGVFHQRLLNYVPSLGRELIERAAAEAASLMPLPDHGPSALEERQLQLVFRHDCLALGCLDPQCVLCQHNPNRRCSVNFDRKYLVNDVLKARCTAPIRVELIDPATGLPVEDKLPEMQLQICVLDGNLYDTKFLESGKPVEGGMEPPEELDVCTLLYNKKKNTPLLVSGSGGSNDSAGYVMLSLTEGRTLLSELHVTDSSEAILSGRKPPFRLLVRAVQPPGCRLRIRHAVSEGFVVATRRTRTAGKVDIPSVDDHVSKLEHMGKETVKKLQDIHTAAQQAGVEIDIPENSVHKVGEFKMLSLRAEQDGHLRQKLQHVLKLSKEKWEEARDHAMRAVVADNRMRAWYANQRNMDVGLLFITQMGKIDLDRPVGLLQSKVEDGEAVIEAVLQEQQTPAQREMVRQLQPQSVTAWWTQGHIGWAIFPMDSETFQQTGSLTTSTSDSPPIGTRSQGNGSAGGAPPGMSAIGVGGVGGHSASFSPQSAQQHMASSRSGSGLSLSMQGGTAGQGPTQPHSPAHSMHSGGRAPNSPLPALPVLPALGMLPPAHAGGGSSGGGAMPLPLPPHQQHAMYNGATSSSSGVRSAPPPMHMPNGPGMPLSLQPGDPRLHMMNQQRTMAGMSLPPHQQPPHHMPPPQHPMRSMGPPQHPTHQQQLPMQHQHQHMGGQPHHSRSSQGPPYSLLPPSCYLDDPGAYGDDPRGPPAFGRPLLHQQLPPQSPRGQPSPPQQQEHAHQHSRSEGGTAPPTASNTGAMPARSTSVSPQEGSGAGDGQSRSHGRAHSIGRAASGPSERQAVSISRQRSEEEELNPPCKQHITDSRQNSDSRQAAQQQAVSQSRTSSHPGSSVDGEEAADQEEAPNPFMAIQTTDSMQMANIIHGLSETSQGSRGRSSNSFPAVNGLPGNAASQQAVAAGATTAAPYANGHGQDHAVRTGQLHADPAGHPQPAPAGLTQHQAQQQVQAHLHNQHPQHQHQLHGGGPPPHMQNLPHQQGPTGQHPVMHAHGSHMGLGSIGQSPSGHMNLALGQYGQPGLPSFAVNSQDLEYVMNLPDNMETSLNLNLSMGLPTHMRLESLGKSFELPDGMHSHQDVKQQLQATASGLETMQSIEAALPDVSKQYGAMQDAQRQQQQQRHQMPRV